jgi:hypothetical protein
MPKNDPKITTDAIKILDHLFFEEKPERLAELEEAREADKMARQGRSESCALIKS